jgi:endoglucanase
LVLLLTWVPAADAAGVYVSQVGYRPENAKWVAVSSYADSFIVRTCGSGVGVHRGALTLRRSADPASGDDVYQGDFSSLMAPGAYYIDVPGVGTSPAFAIGEGTLAALYRQALKGLYYQRCGTSIPSEYGGFWTHGPCHDHGDGIASYDWVTTGGVPGGYRNTIGGWHDAGDYGKYSTNNAYTVGILLQAYEQFGSRFGYDDCGIPESGNGVPDLLDEARWSLEWMLKMQDGDGSVRHRESTANYTLLGPGEDATTRYYTDVSSDATAAQCGAMAIAARVYRDIDGAFAAACSVGAESAWGWLEANPGRVPAGGFANLYGHHGATYVAGDDVHARFWAAAEFFRLTGDSSAKAYVDGRWGEGLAFNGVWYPDSWGAMANLGAFAYRDAPGASPYVVSGGWWGIEQSTLSSADTWTARTGEDGYGCVASTSGGVGDYYWGFTGVILRYAWTLIQAYRYHDTDVAPENAALEQLHYILGRNPMGKVYMTGIGSNPVLHAHAAWNTAAGYTDIEDSLCHPYPYSLVGGPNRADNDISDYPGKCYEDIADPDYYNLGNYTLNETSINIQASLIVVAGYFAGGDPCASARPTKEKESPLIVRASPNPFARMTTILFSLPAEGAARIAVYGVDGRLVRRLVSGRLPAGRHQTVWDGCDSSGRPAAPGVYVVRLESRGTAGSRKLLLVR